MQGPHFLGFFALGQAIELRLRFATSPKLLEPASGALLELLDVAELNGFRGTGLRAGRSHVVLEPVITERALVGCARFEVTVFGGAVDDAEWTGRHAEAAAIANILLHVHRAELRADQRAGGTGLQAGGVGAVLADVRHHQPALVLPLAVRLCLLDELDVPPGRSTQVASIVVAGTCQREAIGRELVPLLAGDFTGFAADAETGIGEEAFGFLWRRRLLEIHESSIGVDHVNRPLRTLHVKALSSWI